jgi:hypothetical protein
MGRGVEHDNADRCPNLLPVRSLALSSAGKDRRIPFSFARTGPEKSSTDFLIEGIDQGSRSFHDKPGVYSREASVRCSPILGSELLDI